MIIWHPGEHSTCRSGKMSKSQLLQYLYISHLYMLQHTTTALPAWPCFLLVFALSLVLFDFAGPDHYLVSSLDFYSGRFKCSLRQCFEWVLNKNLYTPLPITIDHFLDSSLYGLSSSFLNLVEPAGEKNIIRVIISIISFIFIKQYLTLLTFNYNHSYHHSALYLWNKQKRIRTNKWLV